MKKYCVILISLVLLFSIVSFAEEPEIIIEEEYSPVGMWSFYWDAWQLNKTLGSKGMSFEIQAYTLFLLDNGAAYMQQAYVKKDKSDFTPLMLSGIWLGDMHDLTIKVGDSTFKAWIDSTGRLFLKMTDEMATIFQHIDSYDYNEGMIKKSKNDKEENTKDNTNQSEPVVDSFHAAADNYEGYKLRKGRGYIIGDDIPEGNYMIEFDFNYGRFYIYSSKANFDREIAASTELVGTDNGKKYVYSKYFTDGEVIKVNQSGCTVYRIE